MEVLQEDIDFLEHFGVLGMHWGVRNDKPSQHQLNKSSRKITRARQLREVETARKKRKSGAVKKDYKSAKVKYKIDKARIGRSEARRTLNKAKMKKYNTIQKSREAKNGKELVRNMAISGGIDLALSSFRGQ